MKTPCTILATALAAVLRAAVPLAWDVRPGNPAPALFDRYHGETLSLSATFRGFGELPFADGADVRLWYQTNGMGTAWWSAPATVRSNVIEAVWSPEMDPGAERVSLFFGAPSNAYAAAVLRLRHSPGFAPGAMPDPESFRENDPVFAEWLAATTRKFDPGADVWTVSGAMDLRLGKERDGYYVGTSGGTTYALLYTWHEWTFGTAQDNATVTGEPAATNLAFEIGGATYALSKGELVDVPLATLDDIPSADLTPSTNYTDRALTSFAATGTVARARSYGTAERWTDAQGRVWEAPNGWTVYTNGVVASGWLTYDYSVDSGPEGNYVQLRIRPTEEAEDDGYPVTAANFPEGVTPFWNNDYETLYNSDVDLYGLTYGDTIRVKRGETNLVGRVALTNDIPAAPDLSPIKQDIADLRTESAIVYRLYSGSNVVAEVTNYNSQVHAPELRLMQLNGSNEYITVWAETNGLARTLASANGYTDAAITNRAAPRAWSKVTAGMGVEAPSNTTWLSTARTVIAGGLEYEKHVTSGGSIWLLEANGMTPDFHPQTNNTAFLDLANADGTPIFRVEKTDSFLVGVHIDAVTVDGNALVCSVGVVAAEHPLVRVRASLSSGEWIREEDGIPASLATVTWSGSTGNWTCRIQNNTGGGHLFAQMEYLQEGGTKIVNAAPMSVSQGILCTDGIHKCRPVYSNGSITWEVVP